MDLRPHLDRFRERQALLVKELNDPGALSDPNRLRDLRREHARLEPVLMAYDAYLSALKERQGLDALLNGADADLRRMAQEDAERLDRRLGDYQMQLQLAILPRDPNEDRNILLEVRAGTGGDEAGLFAGDLLRMYTRYAEAKRWTLEAIETSLGERGSVKEAIVQIRGEGVWTHLKFERGVHRVQRVPATEASGRIHTSTATVAVLPEAEEVDVEIRPADLRVDTYRASGAGGQHINKTDSAVRLTHLPSGLVVACQDERSQIKNRAKAMRLLRSRLLEMAQQKQEREISQNRRLQVGSGDRSEKIRTYNFPQDRVTDHRINENFHNLPAIMEGKLDSIVEALQRAEKARQLEDLAR